MKALIVLENHFYVDKNNKVWCDRVVDYNYLKRYLNNFDSIIVAGRSKRVEYILDNKLLVSGEKVEFVEMPDFKGAYGLLKNLMKLKKIIRNTAKNVDCIIYRVPTHISLATYKEVVKLNKPLGFEFMMAANKMFDGEGIIKDVLNKIIDIKVKKMCLKANGVSYVTEKILQERYPCKAIMENNNTRYFTESYSSIDIEREDYYKQNWNENCVPTLFKLIHIGYMDSYRKGQQTLLKAFKIVKEEGYNVKLTLIGDGEKRSEFENLAKELNIQDFVEFKGLIKDKKIIFKLLRNSHLFVFPTQSEGLPRTIIEAMSQGLPCISSPVDGIPELLDKEFLISYDDYVKYAEKIIELLDNWKRMVKLSDVNFEKSKKYEKEKLDQKRKNFYGSFLNLINK